MSSKRSLAIILAVGGALAMYWLWAGSRDFEQPRVAIHSQIASQTTTALVATPASGTAEQRLEVKQAQAKGVAYETDSDLKNAISDLTTETNGVKWRENLNTVIEMGLRTPTRNTWTGLDFYLTESFKGRSFEECFDLISGLRSDVLQKLHQTLHKVEGLSQWNMISGKLLRKARDETDAKSGLAAMQDAVKRVPDATMRTSMAAYLSYTQLPQGFGDAIKTLNEQGGDESAKKETFRMVMQRESRSNPENALTQFLALGDQYADSVMISPAFSSEVFRGSELSLSSILRDAPSSLAKDTAIACMVRALSKTDMESAMTWAAEIQDPQQSAIAKSSISKSIKTQAK